VLLFKEGKKLDDFCVKEDTLIYNCQYAVKYNFRDIMRFFSTNGIMSE